MIGYDLPRTVEVGGTEYQIRTDYRPVLDVCSAWGDPELEDHEKLAAVLDIFYFSPGFGDMPPDHWQEALEKCRWFIDGGDQLGGRSPGPVVMDWEQDFPLIAAPVSRVYGGDIRAVPYDPQANQGGLHWWTFLSLYLEVGDCLFAQVVRLRDMRARGKKLDKQDREFYRRNRELIDLRTRYTEREKAFLKEWGAG